MSMEQENDSPVEDMDADMLSPPMDADMLRLQQDSALRHHLGIGSHFTGPKGILADRKFHKQQEQQRQHQKEQEFLSTLNQKALSSGWMERQIQAPSQDPESGFLISESGFLTELTHETYVDAIDFEDPSVLVFIHLYDNSNQYCRIVNEFLVQMAQNHRQCKFYKIPAKEADPNFDSIALPAILIYKRGGRRS
jgi:hypothetical protein